MLTVPPAARLTSSPASRPSSSCLTWHSSGSKLRSTKSPSTLTPCASAPASPARPPRRRFVRGRSGRCRPINPKMKSFTLELPTITFGKSYLIKDKAHELQVESHGHAHTAGDVVVFCPQKRVVATGDMIHGFLPFIADGFPKSWPKTMDSVARLDFATICPGHGPVHRTQQRLVDTRNYIEELTERVEAGKKAGKSNADLQKKITAASLQTKQ